MWNSHLCAELPFEICYSSQNLHTSFTKPMVLRNPNMDTNTQTHDGRDKQGTGAHTHRKIWTCCLTVLIFGTAVQFCWTILQLHKLLHPLLKCNATWTHTQILQIPYSTKVVSHSSGSDLLRCEPTLTPFISCHMVYIV
jgi:hypothetical protein